MSETQQDIEKLWAVSELEQRVATEPDAKTLRELAEHYDELGWPKEALRLRKQAEECPVLSEETTAVELDVPEDPVKKAPADETLKGRFTPRALVEILQALHLTGKSGRLVVEAVGGLAATVIIFNGRLLEAKATGGEVGEAAMHLAVRIKGGCYHFTPGVFMAEQSNLPEDSTALLAAFAAEVAED